MNSVIVVAFLALALPEYRAQYSVMVHLGNNTRSFAIIPDEVDSLVVSSQYRLVNVTRIGTSEEDPMFDFAIYPDVDCGALTCTINLEDKSFRPEMMIEFEFLTTDAVDDRQNLSVTIRQSLNATCASYPIPQKFTEERVFVFHCQPLLTDGINVTNVVWRKFRSLGNLTDFQESGKGSESAIIVTGGNFTVEGNLNRTLKVNSSESASILDVAYYFVPSFVVEGSDIELTTAETLIYAEPTITTPRKEFSYDVIFNRGSARQFDKIRCETKSFPAADVVWILKNDEFPKGQDVSNLTQFKLVDSGSVGNLTFTTDAIINMTNLQYEDDGNFTCTAMNKFASKSQWTVLRVKSPLRPLWPALGILGTILIVTLFLSGSFMVEKVVERHKRSRSSKTVSNSTGNVSERGVKMSSSSSPKRSSSKSNAHNSSQDQGHSSIKRLSSTKPLLEETTTTL